MSKRIDKDSQSEQAFQDLFEESFKLGPKSVQELMSTVKKVQTQLRKTDWGRLGESKEAFIAAYQPLFRLLIKASMGNVEAIEDALQTMTCTIFLENRCLFEQFGVQAFKDPAMTIWKGILKRIPTPMRSRRRDQEQNGSNDLDVFFETSHVRAALAIALGEEIIQLFQVLSELQQKEQGALIEAKEMLQKQQRDTVKKISKLVCDGKSQMRPEVRAILEDPWLSSAGKALVPQQRITLEERRQEWAGVLIVRQKEKLVELNQRRQEMWRLVSRGKLGNGALASITEEIEKLEALLEAA